jgi:hypothetical protein
MTDGMEQGQRLTEVREAAVVGFISVLFFFHFCSVLSIFQVSFVSGDEG